MKIRILNRIAGRSLILASALYVVASAASLSAATIAHWTFEEGSDGASVPGGAGGEPEYSDTVLDISGNGNHMRTWADFSAPTYSSNVAFGTVPQTGLPNTLSLRTVPNQDIYTDGKAINSLQLSAWTVEVSFSASVTEAWQVIVGKDGQPLMPGEPEGGALHGAPPFMLKTMGGGPTAGHLELGLVDGSREFRSIVSLAPLVQDAWYHLAATATADEMSLWMMGPGDSVYVLQGTLAISGAFTGPDDYNPGGFDMIWSVGRGMWAGGIADWFDGYIDQVRISDAALAPSEFLAIPEPGAYAFLVGLGTLAIVLVRRVRK